MTIPLWMVVDVWLTTLPGVRPACRSEASAVARVVPVTWGTGIMCGPAETMSTTVPPLLTRTTPGRLSGRTTLRNVRSSPAPRSLEASRMLRGIFSSAV